MKGLDEYLGMYIGSQLVAILLLIVAIKNTRLARLLFSLLFLWASYINMKTGLTHPEMYLDYAGMALPFYRDFINGWFSHYSHILVPAIAAGQLLIGIGLLLKGWWVRAACLGAMLFLFAIIPLMVGSAFPFSLITIVALWLIWQKDKKEYLWHSPVAVQPAG